MCANRVYTEIHWFLYMAWFDTKEKDKCNAWSYTTRNKSKNEMVWHDTVSKQHWYDTARQGFLPLLSNAIWRGLHRYSRGMTWFDKESSVKNTVWQALTTTGTRFERGLACILTRFDMAGIPSTHSCTRFATIAHGLGHGYTWFVTGTLEDMVVHGLHWTHSSTQLKK